MSADALQKAISPFTNPAGGCCRKRRCTARLADWMSEQLLTPNNPTSMLQCQTYRALQCRVYCKQCLEAVFRAQMGKCVVMHLSVSAHRAEPQA